MIAGVWGEAGEQGAGSRGKDFFPCPLRLPNAQNKSLLVSNFIPDT